MGKKTRTLIHSHVLHIVSEDVERYRPDTGPYLWRVQRNFKRMVIGICTELI